MPLDAAQLREFVVRPTLEALDLWSPAAERLVLGTAAHESGLRYLRQIGGGPALGIYQIEPATHRDLFENYLSGRPVLRKVALYLCSDLSLPPDRSLTSPRHEELIGNLFYATAICRLIYYRRPEALPDADDLPGLAGYWKRHYNTALGKGDVAEFEDHYARLIAPIYR